MVFMLKIQSVSSSQQTEQKKQIKIHTTLPQQPSLSSQKQISTVHHLFSQTQSEEMPKLNDNFHIKNKQNKTQYCFKLHITGMIKQKLSAIKTDNVNLYDHFVKVLRQMVLDNDRNSYELFEYYSQQIKNGQEAKDAFRNEECDLLKEYITKAKQILDKPNTGTEEEPAEPGPTGYVPNLMDEAKWFEKCGVGFGEELTYLIFKSLERLSITKQVKQLRFWGKIIGSNADYYIAESPADPSEEELPPDVEPKGTGINKMAYWVCTDLNGEWKQLPIITPTQMCCSRKIKYSFTGNLERKVFSNPHFAGQESHLLKCQIVRMYYSCSIVPRTMYNVNADDKKEIDPPSEEWKMPTFSFLCEPGNWVHHPQNILKNGRMTILKPEIPEGVEVDEEKLMKELEMKDPLEERLKPVSQDQGGNCSAWTAKKHGDWTEYRAMSKNATETVNYGFICLRSMIWKGWHTVYHNKQWISMYIGSGCKSTDSWYFPKQPEAICGEPTDHEEHSEPNFPPPENKPAEGDPPPAEE